MEGTSYTFYEYGNCIVLNGWEKFRSLRSWVAVYDATGLLYYGEYRSSLSQSVNPYDYSDNCQPVRYSVSFAE